MLYLYWVPSDFDCTHKVLLLYNLFCSTENSSYPAWTLSPFREILLRLFMHSILQYTKPTFTLRGVFFSCGSEHPYKIIQSPSYHHYNGSPQILLSKISLAFTSLERQKVTAIWHFNAILNIIIVVIVFFVGHS